MRHPSDMPIECRLSGDLPPLQERLCNVSEGGLRFLSHVQLEPGYPVSLRIPVADQEFTADAVVAWCRRSGEGFEVGVRFGDVEDQFCMRMVQQLCHIEAYRREVEREEGRHLSSEQAAREWVDLFAADFPSMS